MSNFEWFLLVGVVIVVPLVVAIVVTLWTLEMARQRKRSNRPGEAAMVGVKRNATKARTAAAAPRSEPVNSTQVAPDEAGAASDGVDRPANTPDDLGRGTDGPNVDDVRSSGSTT